MNRESVLVTGSSGFIGTNIVKFLLERGYAVIALDLHAPRCIFSQYRYTYAGEMLGKDADVWVVRGDVRNRELLGKVFGRTVDYVIHLAAISTIQMGAENTARTMSINVGGTEAVLKAVREQGNIKGLIYASTDKVYGRLKGEAYTEKDVLAPLDSPYDRSKAEADRMVREWCREYGIHGIVLRFCNIYGKYDLLDTRIIPGTIKAMLEGREGVLRMYRDAQGNMQNFMRDFLYVDDLCETIGQVMDRLELWNRPEYSRNAQWGEAFNLGVCRGCFMDEVVQRISELTGRKEAPRIEIARAMTEIPKQKMDYTKAESCFGFSPGTSLKEGLEETVKWWREWLQETAGEAGKKDGRRSEKGYESISLASLSGGRSI